MKAEKKWKMQKKMTKNGKGKDENEEKILKKGSSEGGKGEL